MTNDILQIQGINSKGFGIIPKLVMHDKRLTVEAKAIYAYFCSYAGAGQTAFPSRDKILYDLQISENRYYKHFNLLKKYGYIIVLQNIDNIGKFKNNIYTLVEMVEPYLQFDDTDKKPYLQNPCTGNEGTNNNNTKNNNIKNLVMSSQSVKEDRRDEDETGDIIQKIKSYTELIKSNIGYDDFIISHKYDIELIDEMIAIMIDVFLSDSKSIRISGEIKPRELVRHNLIQLTYSDIELVIEQFKGITERISKKKQYILTMLYNVRLEGDSHYINAVTSDRQ